jgi:hypothetical protein
VTLPVIKPTMLRCPIVSKHGDQGLAK